MSERFKIFKTFFSVINKIRLLIINIVFFYFLFLFFAGPSLLLSQATTIPPIHSGSILFVQPKGEIIEVAQQTSMIQQLVVGSSNQFPVSAIVDSIKAAAYDRRISALVFDFSNMSSLSLSIAFEINSAIQEFTEQGKPYYAFSTDYTIPKYLLASSATAIGLDPFGDIDFSGLSVESTFLGGVPEKTGITFEVSKAGTHKGAADTYIQKQFTNEVRTNYTEVLGEYWKYFISQCSKNRKIDKNNIEQYAKTPLAVLKNTSGNIGEALLQLNLVDSISTYRDFLRNHKVSESLVIPCQDFYRTIPLKKSNNEICLISLNGAISQTGSPVQYSDMAISSDLCAKIQQACDSPNVRAIVLRIDSGGGEVFASELIRRKVKQASSEYNIPVVVSMSNTAASGAYWIASSADYIFANPFTLTGSIGVLSSIVNVGQALEKYLGITSDMVYAARKPLSVFQEMLDEEKELQQLQVDFIYNQFLQIVSTGRKLAIDEVAEKASGKIYSGNQALNNGLVDELGTLQDAISFASRLAGIENDFILTSIEKEKTVLESIFEFALNNSISISDIPILKSLCEVESLMQAITVQGRKTLLVYEPFRLRQF